MFTSLHPCGSTSEPSERDRREITRLEFDVQRPWLRLVESIGRAALQVDRVHLELWEAARGIWPTQPWPHAASQILPTRAAPPARMIASSAWWYTATLSSTSSGAKRGLLLEGDKRGRDRASLASPRRRRHSPRASRA